MRLKLMNQQLLIYLIYYVFQICEKQVSEPGLWRVVWQKAHQAPYMFRDNMWVSYDDDNSLGLKVRGNGLNTLLINFFFHF